MFGAVIVPAVFYFMTMAPAVVEIDSGELSAVQYTAGVGHPTGYPLFTWLGWLFTRIPLGMPVIQQINFLALLYVVGSLSVLWWAFHLFFQKVLGVQQELPALIFPSALVMTLGLGKTFWAQATATEVYSLHLLILSAILACLIYIQISKNPSYWLLFAILLGLGFSNHMTTLMLLPGIAWLYFSSHKINLRKTWERLFIMIAIFMGVLGINYGGLMQRAASEPILNWGNPHSFSRLMIHVSGWQYRVWLFSSSKVTKENLAEFFSGFGNEFALILCLVAIPGFLYLFRHHRKWAVFFLICFAFTILYAANYDISDLDAYFLLAYIAYAFILLSGWKMLSDWKPSLEKSFWGLAFIPVFWQVFHQYKIQDRSQEFAFEDYTKDSFGGLPENALIMSYQWDYLVSPSYYYQVVEGFRKDVCMVDKELLRRSWYYPQMQRQHPKVFAKVAADSKEFIEKVTPMEEGRKDFDPQRLEFLFRKIIKELIRPDQYPVYLGIEMVQNDLRNKTIDLPEGYTFVPDKYFMKMIPDTAGYQPLEFSPYQIRFGNVKNTYVAEIKKIAASMAAYRALYEKAAGYPDRAEVWKREALRVKPDFILPEGL